MVIIFNFHGHQMVVQVSALLMFLEKLERLDIHLVCSSKERGLNIYSLCQNTTEIAWAEFTSQCLPKYTIKLFIVLDSQRLRFMQFAKYSVCNFALLNTIQAFEL